MKLKTFKYEFNAGPFATVEELRGAWSAGNCRRAVQYFLSVSRGIFLTPEEVLLPGAYYQTGVFVFDERQPIDFKALQAGDILYAEKIRGKNDAPGEKGRDAFPDQDTYILNLHTALYIGADGKEIWHATAISGTSCYWSFKEFLHFYRPVVVKRI